jgi:predicted ester cyclase
VSLSGSGIKTLVAMFRDAFPDIHFEIDEQLAEGEMVATPETWTNWDTSGLMQTIGAIPQPEAVQA